VEAGPYKVSFDMGPSTTYNVEVNQSWLAEGKLNLHIISGDDTAIIFGYPDQRGDYAREDARKNRLDEDFIGYGIQPDYYRHVIDEQDGLLGVGSNGNLFEAVYSKDALDLLIKIISHFHGIKELRIC
jgi:hypothetical protein